MKIKNLMLATTALAVCLTGCNKDEEKYQEGSGLKASISITIPQITTYAADANAVTNEVVFAKADVFIYDGSTLETHETLDSSTDFDLTVDNAYESTTQIETTTGLKEVYVGLNLPDKIVNAIKNSGIKAGLATAAQITVSDLVDDGTGSKGFAMFSTQAETGTFVEDSDPTAATANKVSVIVERLVAKVTVQEGAGLTKTVEGGTISNLQFTMRNSNKYIYPLQQKDASGNIIDPNWNSYVTSAAITDFESFTDYTAVNTSGAVLGDLNNKYVPENTSDKHATEESTYASLRAAFAPSQFVDDTGAPKTPVWTAGSDFWTVTFADGTLNYFDVETEADDYILANPLKGGVKNKYTDGYCYYNMFLDLTGGYNTIRNHYYRMTINSIKGLGNPNPEDGGNTPNPVPSSTHIDVEIDIAEWTLVTDGYDL